MSTDAAMAGERHDRSFYVGMSVAMLLTVFIGFAPTLYLRPATNMAALTPLLELHGAVFSAWMLLFFVQTALVASRHTGVHRKMGLAGIALALAMLVIGVQTAIEAARLGHAPAGIPVLPFLAIPLTTIIVFATTVAAAVYFRRRKEVHKRLMLVATIGILTPAIARMLLPIAGAAAPPFALLLTDLFLLPCLINDKRNFGRIHPAYLWGGGFLITSQIGRLLLARTETWRDLAAWLIS